VTARNVEAVPLGKLFQRLFAGRRPLENLEENLAKLRALAEHAASRGIHLGGYSLLSSRRIGNGQDVVSPEGERPTHGSCPALTSEWGQAYFHKLRAFFEVDRHHVAVAALKALADEGTVPMAKVTEAIAKYGIDPEKPFPLHQ